MNWRADISPNSYRPTVRTSQYTGTFEVAETLVTVAQYPTSTILEYPYGRCGYAYTAHSGFLLTELLLLLKNLNYCAKTVNFITHGYHIAPQNELRRIMLPFFIYFNGQVAMVSLSHPCWNLHVCFLGVQSWQCFTLNIILMLRAWFYEI